LLLRFFFQKLLDLAALCQVVGAFEHFSKMLGVLAAHKAVHDLPINPPMASMVRSLVGCKT
jgi:hypothetical protein